MSQLYVIWTKMNKQEWESLFKRAQGERASKWQWWAAESHVETSEGPMGSNARIVPYVESARNISTLPIFLTLHTCTDGINNYSREWEFIMFQEFPKKQYMCVKHDKTANYKKFFLIYKNYYINDIYVTEKIQYFSRSPDWKAFYDCISVEIASLKDRKD